MSREWIGRPISSSARSVWRPRLEWYIGRASIAEALGNPALTDVLLPYAPYPFLVLITAVMPTALVAVGRAGLAARLNAFGGVTVVVGVLTAVAIEPDMAVGLVVAQLCVALVSTYAVYRTVGISLRGGGITEGLRALLATTPAGDDGVAGMFAFQFDRLVVSREFSPALYAVYVVGAVELPLTIIVQQSVNSVLVPALARHYAAGDLAGLAAQWQRAIRRTSFVLLPLFVFFISPRTRPSISCSEQLRAERGRFPRLAAARDAPCGDVRSHHAGDRATQINLTASLVLWS